MTKYEIIVTIICMILLVTTIIGFSMYQQAVRYGAKGIVTALEMVVACEQLSNVTNQQIMQQTISNHINKTITK